MALCLKWAYAWIKLYVWLAFCLFVLILLDLLCVNGGTGSCIFLDFIEKEIYLNFSNMIYCANFLCNDPIVIFIISTLAQNSLSTHLSHI